MYPRFGVPRLLLSGLLFLAAEASSVPLKIGVPAVEGGLSAARTWNLVCSFLSGKLGHEVQYQVFEDHAGLLRSLKERYVDVALLDPAWFLWKREGLSPIAEVRLAGIEDRSILIVQKNSIVYRVEGFSGASFALSQEGATAAGYFVPLAMLAAAGVKAANLRRTVYAQTSESVLKSVAYGGLDGGAVPKRLLEKGETIFSDFVRVVAESGPLPFPVLVRRKEDPAEGFRSLEEALLAMMNDRSGGPVLAAAGIEGFRTPAAPLFENLSSYLSIFESAYGAPK